ncbi:MAG: MutS-related protein [Dysgonomonas sp.]|jgi:DNA mismatch repair ATPase MutS|uniref:MutS-related protein n=1 Tax=Dysgonomonas sp. TaxID=1891233 RepID=UPI002820D0E2|nr:DNA mismatch repair protein [Prevotella sp.]
MSFIIDKQTIDDLNIFPKNGKNSVFNIYNNTQTRGGSILLEEMFRHPLDNLDVINKRQAIIRYFYKLQIDFPFHGSIFDAIEYYLSNTDTRTQINASENKLKKQLQRLIQTDTEFQAIQKSILGLIDVINILDDFLKGMTSGELADTDISEIEDVKRIISDEKLQFVKSESGTKKLSLEKAEIYDTIFRYDMNKDMRKILSFIYKLDIYISLAKVAQKKDLAFAEAQPADNNILDMKGLFHPLLTSPKANTIKVISENNVIFLTGANMAGKSTFMKSFGIAVFLAHLGFPVPAEEMTFSIRNGMYTTINLPDNLNQGYSHFYAEVLRLKKIAGNINHYKNMIVIFDELFRGTNVKDAYDATIAITEAFAENRNSIFIISTHIIESADILKERCSNINFVYLPTGIEDGKPKYTYTLSQGITNDRHGMMIINNENILDILIKNNTHEK